MVHIFKHLKQCTVRNQASLDSHFYSLGNQITTVLANLLEYIINM